eukprot:g15324.t1
MASICRRRWPWLGLRLPRAMLTPACPFCAVGGLAPSPQPRGALRSPSEMLTLTQRHISEELLQQVERHQECFDMPKAPRRSGSEGAIESKELLERLQRTRLPRRSSCVGDAHRCVRAVRQAEDMVVAMETELQALHSPVLDIHLPEAGEGRLVVVAYVFNGDIVDRGRHAVEIWLLLIAFKMSHPQSVFVLRGNHENDQMIQRPFKMGGGFAEECLGKYNHSLLSAFQRMFKLLPIFAVIEKEIFLVHGGLFRNPSVNLQMLRQMPQAHWQRNYPNPLPKEEQEKGYMWTEEEEILFDALWADPHYGLGSRRSERGKVAVMFGEDITHRFLDDAKLSMCMRSHRVPQNGSGGPARAAGRAGWAETRVK